ncbi:TetR family transcriptional regulator [Enemella evansiae]|uniref:TetR/AcrR family transcriptional regulator n=1 Tax=Enemella evansiae TaxID=2016499 RepID=UPI000B97479F|nr:TetR/AcrR family transcriptional regulator [Enemella evansiae]OYO11084.1 TetR family transcriptional regulator [Enemella evansiae]
MSSTSAADTSAGSATRRAAVDKRRSILDAAAPVFGEFGYQRAGVDAIATAAGVSKPTIYSYFGGKEQLFRASVADSAQHLNAESLAVVQALDVRPQHWETSLRKAAYQLSVCQRSDCAAALGRLINAEATRDPEVFRSVRRAGYQPIVDALAGKLAMLGNAGLLDLPDPVLAAKQFFALIHAELPDLTALGTQQASDRAVRTAVEAGVATFLRAYAAAGD